MPTKQTPTNGALNTISADTGIMICGHGSRDRNAVEEFNQLAVEFKSRLKNTAVESGFLEFATPVIRDGLDALKSRGIKKIICLPGMLFAAGHVKNDLPSEINNYAAENPELELIYAADLGIDARMLNAAHGRIFDAITNAPGNINLSDTMILVVGRGTNDSDANSNVCKVTRMLWEGLGVGWAETAYSGVATPLVDSALERCVKMGFKRIVVFPYFLFTGILVKRIYSWADEAAGKNPDIQFIKADYLGHHPDVIATFLSRVDEAINGTGVMNCQLCKYREQIIGHEHDHGAPQVGHHHHVQGIGTEENAQDHGHHHHAHGHGHHHHDHSSDEDK